jgi:hypothetical protein
MPTVPLPVIMLTAKTGSTNKVEALRIGVDDYLTKPFVEEELIARVQGVIRNSRQRMGANGSSPAGGTSSEKEQALVSKADLKWLEEVEGLFYTMWEINVRYRPVGGSIAHVHPPGTAKDQSDHRHDPETIPAGDPAGICPAPSGKRRLPVGVRSKPSGGLFGCPLFLQIIRKALWKAPERVLGLRCGYRSLTIEVRNVAARTGSHIPYFYRAYGGAASPTNAKFRICHILFRICPNFLRFYLPPLPPSLSCQSNTAIFLRNFFKKP